jgi:hypothetical protein
MVLTLPQRSVCSNFLTPTSAALGLLTIRAVQAETDDVSLIRIRYLKLAVNQVREVAAMSPSAACNAAAEVRRYVEWVKDLLPTGERGEILEQINAFQGA